jgi:hypothetical protein
LAVGHPLRSRGMTANDILSLKMFDIVQDILRAVNRSLRAGVILENDANIIMDNIKTMYDQLYAQTYPEFKERFNMVQVILDNHYEQLYAAHEQAWQNKEQAWQNKEQAWQNEKQTWQNERKRAVQKFVQMKLSTGDIAQALGIPVEEVVNIIKEKDNQQTEDDDADIRRLRKMNLGIKSRRRSPEEDEWDLEP